MSGSTLCVLPKEFTFWVEQRLKGVQTIAAERQPLDSRVVRDPRRAAGRRKSSTVRARVALLLSSANINGWESRWGRKCTEEPQAQFRPRLIHKRHICCGSYPIHKPYSQIPRKQYNSLSLLLSLSFSSMTVMRIVAWQCAGTMEMILIGSMEAPMRWSWMTFGNWGGTFCSAQGGKSLIQGGKSIGCCAQREKKASALEPSSWILLCAWSRSPRNVWLPPVNTADQYLWIESWDERWDGRPLFGMPWQNWYN